MIHDQVPRIFNIRHTKLGKGKEEKKVAAGEMEDPMDLL